MDSTRTYELAGIGERFIALVIDLILFGIIGSIIGFGGSWWGGGLAGFLVGVVYQWYFLTRQNGQTPGKMLLNIRVIKVDGSKIEDADAVLRYIGYLISYAVLLLGFIWALFDDNRQGWHDKIAKTYVVKANESVKLKNDQL